MTNRQAEIHHLIEYIQMNLHEPLTVDHLARYISYSPFHFTRIFKQTLGLTPQHYVSSLRLQRAKDLLLTTRYSVRDIALEVGQQSLGTFTTRFAQRIGVTPAEYRNSASTATSPMQALSQLQSWQVRMNSKAKYPYVQGMIRSDHPCEGIVLIGLFAKPIPEGLPLYGTLVKSIGEFILPEVKPGIYYVMATSVHWGMKASEILLPHHTLRTRSRTPIVVKPYTPIEGHDVVLYPPRLDDPPILISIPVLMKQFLRRMTASQGI